MQRGEIWWASLREPLGSEPGYRRPVVIISTDDMNLSSIKTVLTAILTTNLNLANAPGNVAVSADETGLAKASVVNVSQLVTVDKAFMTEYVGIVEADTMIKVAAGLRLIMVL